MTLLDTPCILIVGDRPSFGQMLSSHIARLDAVAVAVPDVSEAIALLERITFDLVLADRYLASELSAHLEWRFPDLPVVLIGGERERLLDELPELVERARVHLVA
jgi:CheY-like chemotaxis protein